MVSHMNKKRNYQVKNDETMYASIRCGASGRKQPTKRLPPSSGIELQAQRMPEAVMRKIPAKARWDQPQAVEEEMSGREAT